VNFRMDLMKIGGVTMKVKSYPLVMVETEHAEIKAAAKENGQTIKDFIMEAIKDKIKKVGV